MCDSGPESLPSSLRLLDQLRTAGSSLRSQLCVAVSTISRRIAKEQQRALTQVRLRALHTLASICARDVHSKHTVEQPVLSEIRSSGLAWNCTPHAVSPSTCSEAMQT